MRNWLRNPRQRRGQGMVELALILCLIAVVVLVALTQVGNQLLLTYQDIQEAVTNPDDPGQQAAFTCPDGTTAILHGHKFHCH